MVGPKSLRKWFLLSDLLYNFSLNLTANNYFILFLLYKKVNFKKSKSNSSFFYNLLLKFIRTTVFSAHILKFFYKSLLIGGKNKSSLIKTQPKSKSNLCTGNISSISHTNSGFTESSTSTPDKNNGLAELLSARILNSDTKKPKKSKTFTNLYTIMKEISENCMLNYYSL